MSGGTDEDFTALVRRLVGHLDRVGGMRGGSLAIRPGLVSRDDGRRGNAHRDTRYADALTAPSG